MPGMTALACYAACWARHDDVAAAAAAFCALPAVAHALAERAAGLPPRLEGSLQRCLERFGSGCGGGGGSAAALGGSLFSSEGDAAVMVHIPSFALGMDGNTSGRMQFCTEHCGLLRRDSARACILFH